MKTKTIILLAFCAVMMLSFSFVNSKKTDTASLEKNQKSIDNEVKIGLLSEDKL